MSNVFMKAEPIHDWRELLANGETQWKEGYSAKSLSNAWKSIEGFPKEIQAAFNTSNDDTFEGIKFLYGFPEYKVKIQGGTRPSQNDLYVLAISQGTPVCIMVEGKVNEDFGPLVSKWICTANKGFENPRLQYLINLLGFQGKEIGDIRYQLLHRTASALLEAEKIRTGKCMVIIHSFSQEKAHFDDYKNFVELFGVTPEVNKISSSIKINDKQIYFLWAVGNEKYTKY